MRTSVRRSGVAASSPAAARMSSSVAVPISSVSVAVNGRPSRCTNRWPEPVGSTSKSVSSATTSGRAVMAGPFGRRELPVMWVVAVLASAVQRPCCEPAAVMNLQAQRADHRSIRKIPPQVVTHDIGDIPRWSPGQGRLRCLGAVNSRGPAVRPALDTVSLAAPARTCTTGGCAMSTENKKFADDVRVEKRRLDASENDALIGIARMGADAFGYTADLRIDRQLAQLLRLRVSQLNNCTYCLNLHYQAAREAGIPRPKIDTLSAWWETELYSDAEQAALRYAEALTRAADTDQDAAFQRFHDALAENFNPEQMLEIVGVVVNMNVWTRIKLAEGAMPSLP